MRLAALSLALAALWAAGPAAAQEGSAQTRYPFFTPPSRLFSCEIPVGWSSFETETLRGKAVHIVGPRGSGTLRPAYHIHHFDKTKPGFLPGKDALRRELKSDKASGRESSATVSVRAGRNTGKMFEVREERLLPEGRLPAKPARLHHFYAFLASGADEYIMIKLSCPEEDFVAYRQEFRRFLKSFRVLGY